MGNLRDFILSHVLCVYKIAVRSLSPDHKTIARFRSDNKKPLRNVFRDFVKLCMKMGLYGKEIVAVDGSKFKAVNSRERNFNEEKL